MLFRPACYFENNRSLPLYCIRNSRMIKIKIIGTLTNLFTSAPAHHSSKIHGAPELVSAAKECREQCSPLVAQSPGEDLVFLIFIVFFYVIGQVSTYKKYHIIMVCSLPPYKTIIAIIIIKVPITRRANSFLAFFLYTLIERQRRSERQNNNNRPINLPKVITFFTDYKYPIQL